MLAPNSSPRGYRPAGAPWDLTSSGEINSPCGKVPAVPGRLDGPSARDGEFYLCSVSKRMVTGPWFTEETSMLAPNSPWATRKPRSRQRAMKAS